MRGRRGASTLALVGGLGLVILVVGVVAWRLLDANRRGQTELLRDALRRLVVAQESYYYDHRVYAADVDALTGRGYRPGPEVRVVVHEATRAGWSATAAHRSAPVECALFVRDAAPVGSAAAAGAIVCD